MGLLLSLCIELHRIQDKSGHMATSTSQPPENAMVLSPVLDYIEDHYDEPFDVNYLASICCLSPTHFRRVFHDIIGRSPLEFLNSTRIVKACNCCAARNIPSSIFPRWWAFIPCPALTGTLWRSCRPRPGNIGTKPFSPGNGRKKCPS